MPEQPAFEPEPTVPPAYEPPPLEQPPLQPQLGIPPLEPGGYEVPPEPGGYQVPPEPGGYQVPPEFQPLPGEYAQQPDPLAQQPDPYAQQGHQLPPPVPPPFDGAAYGSPYAAPPPPPSQTPGPYATVGGAAVIAGATADKDGSDSKPSHFRPDIQGLRAIAIIAVLLFHVGVPHADGGFIGVDVFYVISGFLITGLLIREGHGTGKVDLLRFYARRMRRLLPAALLVILVTLGLSAVIVTPLRLSEIAGDAAASALYVANFRFALEATDYLAVEAQSPLLHYWSLGVEEQFYLVWPLILLVATRFLSLRWVGLFLLILAIGSFALSLYWTEENFAWAFFSPVTRAWQLAAGALIAVGLLRIPRRIPAWSGGVAVVVGLALIVASVVLISGDVPFPGMVALVPVLGAVLVIAGGLRGPTLPGRILLANPVSRYFGHISYSLYLWHWPLLILVPIALETDDLQVRLALAGVAIVIAAISTELVEQPFRRSSALEKRTRFSLQMGLAGSVAVGVGALFMSGAIVLPSSIPVPWLRPDPVVVELTGVREDLPAHYADECNLTLRDKKLHTDCVYGDPEGGKTAMLIGDSHAAQWMPALDTYAAGQGWRLEVHTKAACPLSDVPVWENRLRRAFDECDQWRAQLLKHVRKTKPEAVFVGLSRDYELWDGAKRVQSRDATGYWQEKLTELLTTLGRRAQRVVLLAETPFLNYDPVDCLADDDISNCDPATLLAIDSGYAALEAAAAEETGADLLSINGLLCPGSTCPVVRDDIVVFRDAHHLTATYMEHLAKPIERMLEGLPPYPTPRPSLVPEASSSAS